MLKKIVSVLMSISVVSMLLAGCSSSGRKTNVYFEDLAASAAITVSENASHSDALSGAGGTWNAEEQGAYVEIDFGKDVTLNTVILREKSDCVKQFTVYYLNGSDYTLLYQQDRIDEFRLCATEEITTSSLWIVFDSFDGTLKLGKINVCLLNDYNRNDFKVTSYITSSVDAQTGKSQIQQGSEDDGFVQRFSVLTDAIIIGVVGLNEDGTLRCDDVERFKNDVQILKQINPDMNVRFTLMTGLVDGDFNANKRAIVKFVNNGLDEYQKNLSEFIAETGVDGVDFDWEYPQLPHEWSAYGKLLIATKQTLNGGDVSVALWPYGVNLSKEARACIDNVNIMAYDQFDERGDQSSIYEMGQKTIDYFLDLGFSKEQLCLGIPFYGRTADEYAIWPSYDEDYGKWGNYRENFEYQDAEGVTQTSTVYLNGYAMVRDKTALALYNDLGGIMIFNSNCDISYNSEYALHRAVNEVMEQRIR